MPHNAFQIRLARVQSMEEARALLTEALSEGRRQELVAGDYPYDLDLAGMLFPINNRGPRPDEPTSDHLTPDRLGELFADAVWEMCVEGLLRPGPRSPLDKTFPQSSGYCLTSRGKRFLAGEKVA